MVIKIIKKGNSIKEATVVPHVIKDGVKHTFMSPSAEVEVIKPKKVVKKLSKPLTIRQERVVGMVAKGSNSKAQILRDAGYSEAVARQPHKVFDSPEVQEAIEPILDRLIRHRDRVLQRMEMLVDTAGYTSLSITIANMNKDIELLSGRPTTREEHILPEEERKQLDNLLEMNKE